MWSLRVVFDPPEFDDSAGLCHGDEPVLVQASVSELAVKGFDVGILVRLSGTDKREIDVGLVCPAVEDLPLELRRSAHRR